MDIQTLLIFQIVADIILCVAILFLLWGIRKSVRQPKNMIDKNSLNEFRRLLDESQIFGTHFLQALEDGRDVLKEIASTLNAREKVIRNLIHQSEDQIEKLKNAKAPTESSLPATGNIYSDVVNLARQGLSNRDISKVSGLAEGEVELIVDLAHKRESNR
jgi:hypothetical protein